MQPQGFILLNTKIIHLHEHNMFKQLSNQVSAASYMISAKINQGFKVDLSRSIMAI